MPTAARRQLASLRTPDGAMLSVSGSGGGGGDGGSADGGGGGGGGRLELAELHEPHDLGFAARRRGGSDAANAATWRLVPVPPPSTAAGGGGGSSAAAAAAAGATVEQEQDQEQERELPVALEAFAEPNRFVAPIDSEGDPMLTNTNPRPRPRLGPGSDPDPTLTLASGRTLALTRRARASSTRSSQGRGASQLLAPPWRARRRRVQSRVYDAARLVRGACGGERGGRWRRGPRVGGGGGACVGPERGTARGRVPASELLGVGTPNPGLAVKLNLNRNLDVSPAPTATRSQP